METTLKKIGKYEITGILGRGGMGVVYRAEDKRIGRKVAIKTLTEGFTGQPEMLERFYREAQAGILQHPNIVIVFDLGDEDGMPFIVMEFVDGEPLDKIISSGRQLPLIEKLSIIEQVCLGLGYAHRRGVVHRDIKPANVIVQPDGHAKIVDFGIARVQGSAGEGGLTRTGNVIGTIHYIAPERLKGQPFDGRSDIFACGVMLYQMLAGQLPFSGAEDMTVLQKLVNEQHPPLGNFLKNYPPELDAILDRALAKDPEQRYATAEEFAAELHGLGEELKKGQISELYSDAERLASEQQYGRAREVLLQLVRIDPQHTSARQLLGAVQQNLARMQRAEQVRQLIAESDEAIGASRFPEAINSLEQAVRLDPDSQELKTRLAAARDKKQRFDEIAGLMTQADSLGQRGDWSGAAGIIEKAIPLDPADTKIRALFLEYSRQAKIASQQGQIRELLDRARPLLSARRFTEAIQVLQDVRSIDPAQAEMEAMLQAAVSGQEQERRRKLLEQIQAEIENSVAAEDYDRATNLAERAVQQLPNEAALQQLLTRVKLQAKKFYEQRLVATTVARAQELFLTSPAEALLIVQEAIAKLPGEPRLLSIEDSLRQRLKAAQIEEVRGRYLREAQDAMGQGRFDRAVEILESYTLEFNDAAGVSDVLEMARGELAQQQQRQRIANVVSNARTLIGEGRLDDAIRLLEPAMAETGDGSLSRLLEEARAQRAEAERKAGAAIARIAKLREQSRLDEAIEQLQAMPAAATPGSQAHGMLAEMRKELARKQDTSKALAAATQAIEKGNFQSAIETLEAVQRAWGETPELARGIAEIETRRKQLANETVARAIDIARGLIATNDAPGALKELKAAAEQVGYADAELQSDWKRLGAEAAKPIQRKTGTVAQLDFDVAPAPKRNLVPMIAGGGVLVVALIVGAVLMLKPHSGSGGANGGGGGKPLPTAGTLVVHTTVDGKPAEGVAVNVDRPDNTMVLTLPSGSATVDLDPGLHKIIFSSSQLTACNAADITITAGKQTPIECQLTKPVGPVTTPVTDAYITIHSNPDAQVSVDGTAKGNINAHSNTLLVHLLDVKPGVHKVTLTLKDYKELSTDVVLNPGDHKDTTLLLTPTVTTGKAQPPSALFTANAASIEQGGSVTLNWSTANASEVEIDNGVGSVGTSGSKSVTPQKDTVYTLTAKGDGGSKTFQASVTVTAVARKPVQILSFSASAQQIVQGDPTTLSWKAANSSGVTIDGIGQVDAESQTTLRPATTTTYTLTATGDGGPQTRSITITVQPKTVEPRPPTQPAVDDVKAIQATVAKFQNLWNAHDIAQLKTIWTGMTPQQEHLLGDAFRKGLKDAKVSESCSPLPPTGDSVTWSCSEATSIPGVPPQSHGVRFTFVKRGDGWYVGAKN